MARDIKANYVQLYKNILKGEFFDALLGQLACLLMKNIISLTNNIFVPLATMASALETNGTFQRKGKCMEKEKQ